MLSGCATLNHIKEEQGSWIVIYEKTIPCQGTYSVLKNANGKCFLDFQSDFYSGNVFQSRDYQRDEYEIWNEPVVIEACGNRFKY